MTGVSPLGRLTLRLFDTRKLAVRTVTRATSRHWPVIPDPKLRSPSASRRTTARRTTDEWVAADQRETRKTVATLALVAIFTITGLWLILGAVVR